MMITRNQTKNKTVLILAALALAVLGFTTASANAAIVLEEQFAYEFVPQDGDNGVAVNGLDGGTGFDGAWVATQSHGRVLSVGLGDFATGVGTTLNEDRGLSFSTLPVAGTAMSRWGAAGRAQANRSLSAASQAALTGDNTTIWFSVLISECTSNKNMLLVFGTEAFAVTPGRQLAAVGDGFGVSLTVGDGITDGNGDGSINACVFDNSQVATVVVGTFTPILQSGGTHHDTSLIVGKINWKPNGTPDELFLFNVTDPSSEPAEVDAIASITDKDLDQSAFDTIALYDGTYAIIDEIRFGNSFSDAIGIPGPTNPSPANGAKVPIGNVDLSWTNMDPNSPGDSVYVDVLFGTEPNVTHPGYDMTKQVTDPVSGENVTSVTVSAPTEGTYYWRVNSYINGPGHINEPNMIEGSLWSFNAVDDVPPSVDAGDDMITWSGEPVQLDPNVVDDGKSALTWLWTADPAAGITVEFDPSAAVEDPTVTITKVPYSEASIVNAGFEDPAAGDTDYTGNAAGWSITGTGGAGTWNPGPDYNTEGHGFGGIAPEGENVGWVWSTDSDTGFSQVLAETLAVDTTYTLTVQVGQNSYYAINYGWPGYKVQLLAGGNLLKEDPNSFTPIPDTFETSTVTFDSTGVNPDWVGEPLEIRLLNKNAMETEIHFDDVKLVADPPFPAPTGMSIVTLTLAVNDEGNPTPVPDTMTIDVYDDACQMARIGLALSNISDFDNNCITDLRDYAVLAAKWLDDIALTAPVPK